MRIFITLFLLLHFCCPTKVIAQDQLYATTVSGDLYRIDLSNCSSTLIGKAPVVFTDIALHPITKQLYGVTGERLFLINPETADAIFIRRLSAPAPFFSYYLNAATFDDEGLLYLAGFRADTLVSYNLETDEFISLGSTETTLTSGGDLAFHEGKLYLATNTNSLLEIDLDNLSQSTVLGDFNTYGAIYGLTSINTPPILYAAVDRNIYQADNQNLTNLSLLCQGITPLTIYGTAPFSTPLSLDPFTIKLVMPNAFSPNNDGQNDTFIPIEKQNVTILTTVIYNRWGQQVYQSSDDKIAWDGNNQNGSVLPTGIYFWQLKAVDYRGIIEVQQGQVHLLK